jgi:hypothetical protein
MRKCSSSSAVQLRKQRAECRACRVVPTTGGTTRLSDLTPSLVSTAPYQTTRLLELLDIDGFEDLV